MGGTYQPQPLGWGLKRKELIMSNNPQNIDALEEDYLYVIASQIPASGMGLHTAIAIYKDEVIALFKGELLSNKESNARALLGKNQYFISLLNGGIMDSANTDCFAKYANDANGSDSTFKNNAKISLNEQSEICLIATRKIKAGEEIFCSYGKRYWGGEASGD